MFSQIYAVLVTEVFVIMLVFCRIGSMFVMLPAYGETYISPRFRLLVALAITVILVTPLSQYISAPVTNPAAMMLLIIGEVTVGFFLGFLLRVIFNIFTIAGTFITYLTGFANAQLFNPVLQGQGGLHAALLTMTAIAVLQSTNLHHYPFMAIVDSYKIFPPGQPILLGDMSETIMTTMVESFKVGFQLSTPFVLGTILFYVLMGIMSRLMPQLQIFFLAQPIQILGGSLLIILVATSMISIGLGHYEQTLFRFIERIN